MLANLVAGGVRSGCPLRLLIDQVWLSSSMADGQVWLSSSIGGGEAGPGRVDGRFQISGIRLDEIRLRTTEDCVVIRRIV